MARKPRLLILLWSLAIWMVPAVARSYTLSDFVKHFFSGLLGSFTEVICVFCEELMRANLPPLPAYDNLRFRASDYREGMEHAWYPPRVTRAGNETAREVYLVKDIALNPPLDPSLLGISLLVREQLGEGEKRRAPLP